MSVLILVVVVVLLALDSTAQEPGPHGEAIVDGDHAGSVLFSMEQKEDIGLDDTFKEHDIDDQEPIHIPAFDAELESELNHKLDSSSRPGKWGTGVASGSGDEAIVSQEDPKQTENAIFDESEIDALEAGLIIVAKGVRNETGGKRHWGQVDNAVVKDTTFGDSSIKASSSNRHIPNLSKTNADSRENAFPEGFALSARVYTGQDGLAHFDSQQDISLPFVYCGADGSTTAGLRVNQVSSGRQ